MQKIIQICIHAESNPDVNSDYYNDWATKVPQVFMNR